MAGGGALVGAGLWYALSNGLPGASRPSGLVLLAVIAAPLAALLGSLYVLTMRLVRGLEERVDRFEHESLHDMLTKLPNRRLFEDRVAQRARERSRTGQDAAIVIVDVNDFKAVNETFGRRSGDQVLVAFAQRLSTRLRRSDTVARLGGDEFGILLSSVDGIAGVTRAVENLRTSLSAPFTVDGISVNLQVSMGVTLLGEQSFDVATHMKRADRALYQAAKEPVGYTIFDPETTGGAEEEMALLADLRSGIARGELRLFYQPKVKIASGKIRSVEALVRWQHPKRGLLTPNVFIPLAETHGLMRQLTYWVLDEAMRQAREWAEKGHGIKVAVNLSQQSLLDQSMPGEIARVLERYGVPAKALEIEITESALVTDIAAANAALTNLHEMGIALSIDDYGTGHSSLAHVRGLPVGCIKIDRAFVSRMLTEPKDAAIVRSTIDLARDLGMGVVAEGVETADEWNALHELDCHVAQGFLVSKPRPAGELMEWLDECGHRFEANPTPEVVDFSTPLPA